MANNRELTRELASARKKHAAPSYNVILGKSVSTLRSVQVDIAQRSTYIIGMPGTGKSTLQARLFLENQDHSKILIDPMGKLSNEEILPNIRDPSKVIYFAPFEQRQRPLGFNPFDLGRVLNSDERDELAGSLRSIFAHLWVDSYRNYPNMAMVIQNSLNLLVQFDGMTFIDMARILVDKEFRTRLAQQVDDQPLRDFWLKHYRNEMGISTYNKLNEFVQIGIVRRVICQRQSSFYIDQAMAQGKTVIVNLGGLQDNATSLIGALFVSRVISELKRREPIPTEKLTPFALFVDEFDLFGSKSFEDLISKCRQQKSSVVIAHQHWGQLSRSMQQSVLQSAYVVAFQVDSITAKGLQAEFGPGVDLTKIAWHQALVRQNPSRSGAIPAVHVITTKKGPAGDPAQARAVKRMSEPLGRSMTEVENTLADDYDVIARYTITHEEINAATEPIQPARTENVQRAKTDWPARFHQRPSVVFDDL